MLSDLMIRKLKERSLNGKKALLVLAWLNLFVGISFYFFQYALRTSISALSPEIKAAFSITPEQLGNIGASYFYIFIVTQIFAGSLIDKYGVRMLLVVSSMLCAIGAIVFGAAHVASWLYVGRICMGAGSAFSLILALTIIERQFSETMISLLIGITGSIGIIGAMSGELLITYLSAYFPWHSIMVIGGGVCIIIAILAFLLFIPHEKNKRAFYKSQVSVKEIVYKLFHDRRLWLAFIFIGIINLVIDLLASLWGIPYLIKEYGLSVAASEMVNSMIFVGFAVGSIVLSLYSRKIGPVMVMRLSSMCCLLCLFLYIFIANSGFWLGTFALLLGFFSGSISVVLIFVGKIAKKSILATAFSMAEFCKHLFSAVLMQLFGWMVQFVHIAGFDQYTLPFIIMTCLILLGCCLTFFMKRLAEEDWS